MNGTNTNYEVVKTLSSNHSSINRRELVERHNLKFDSLNPTEIPQVGNGEIAFGIDPTGLQTFYGNTLAQWGWHSHSSPVNDPKSHFAMTEVAVHNHIAKYPVSRNGQDELFTWLRENPHRLNLGKLSLKLDGDEVNEAQLSGIDQDLDLWRGLIISRYLLVGQQVTVLTTCHPDHDQIAVEVQSTLLEEGRLSVSLSFPYGKATDRNGADWGSPENHRTVLTKGEDSGIFLRELDEDSYVVSLDWSGKAELHHVDTHTFSLIPSRGQGCFSFHCHFSTHHPKPSRSDIRKTQAKAEASWEAFWNSGGCIDLSDSSDHRSEEIERRMVLSQYLMAVNEAGSLPPQESGLINNSAWYGKFHLEMHWWHGAHYQLWGRWNLFERSLHWYRKILPMARATAERQGYQGVRWPKMIGPDGRFSPSKTGPWLIWQQPHPIFYAEQHYRVDSSRRTLELWKEVVFESADFMASYAFQNSTTGLFDLGPWLIVSAENNHNDIENTINPAFELSYWRYGLTVACSWKERMGLSPKKEWCKVLAHLPSLPTEDGTFALWEGVQDMWTKYNRSHVDVIGPGAFLPSRGVDLQTLGLTVERVFKEWDMKSAWGWDFPWLAMASARCGKPEKAIDALMFEASQKNEYGKCGVNRGGPEGTYLPGNGGLLYALAMMAAGWDDGPEEHAPGFPKNGNWNVRHEGLMKAQ